MIPTRKIPLELCPSYCTCTPEKINLGWKMVQGLMGKNLVPSGTRSPGGGDTDCHTMWLCLIWVNPMPTLVGLGAPECHSQSRMDALWHRDSL